MFSTFASQAVDLFGLVEFDAFSCELGSCFSFLLFGGHEFGVWVLLNVSCSRAFFTLQCCALIDKHSSTRFLSVDSSDFLAAPFLLFYKQF